MKLSRVVGTVWGVVLGRHASSVVDVVVVERCEVGGCGKMELRATATA
jgi:hypothetical protein